MFYIGFFSSAFIISAPKGWARILFGWTFHYRNCSILYHDLARSFSDHLSDLRGLLDQKHLETSSVCSSRGQISLLHWQWRKEWTRKTRGYFWLEDWEGGRSRCWGDWQSVEMFLYVLFTTLNFISILFSITFYFYTHLSLHCVEINEYLYKKLWIFRKKFYLICIT